jgi:hypothetical protein
MLPSVNVTVPAKATVPFTFFLSMGTTTRVPTSGSADGMRMEVSTPREVSRVTLNVPTRLSAVSVVGAMRCWLPLRGQQSLTAHDGFVLI